MLPYFPLRLLSYSLRSTVDQHYHVVSAEKEESSATETYPALDAYNQNIWFACMNLIKALSGQEPQIT